MPIIPLGDVPLFYAARKSECAEAVRYPDGALTWKELDRSANKWARAFRAVGIASDDFVAIAMPNGSAFYGATFGAWKIGATPAIVSSRLPRHEFDAIVDLLEPAATVGWRDPANSKRAHVSPDDVECEDDAHIEASIGKHWKAICSGGSTGRAKIIVDHKAGDWNTDQNLGPVVGVNEDTVMLNPGPLYHNAPFLWTHLGLGCGARVVGMERFDPEEALHLIERFQVTWMNLVPTMMHRIWSLPAEVRNRYDVGSLKTVWHMAAPCPAWLKEAWIDWLGPEKIWEMYGGSEGFGSSMISGEEWLQRRGSVGRLFTGSVVKVVADDGRECANGEVGELYFKPAEATNLPSHYIGAEAKRSADGWYSIGDLGSVDSEGFIYLADRRTDLILRGGANVYPAEVEAALEAYPGVEAAIVVGVPCHDLGQRVHAIVKPIAGPFDLAELHKFVAQRLARYKIPGSYEWADNRLRDDAGKARRLALREQRADWLRKGRKFQDLIIAPRGTSNPE